MTTARVSSTIDSVVVRPVNRWRDRRRFVDLPWELYRGDRHWVPPLRGNQRELLGYRPHPFYDDAEIQTFLAWRGRLPCGRIAAIVNHQHNLVHGEQCGFFGFFECVDEPDVAEALFQAVFDWLAQRKIHVVRGPVNPSMNYECGLLIDGFDSPPTFLMTYNPAYYVKLIEGVGFRKAHDLYAYLGHRDQLPEIQRRLDPLTDQAQARTNAVIRPISPKRFMHDVRLFLELYNRSFGSMWGFVPLGDREMQKLAGSLRHLIIPELALLAEVEGRVVGAVVGLPDYNPRIRDIDGRLYPFGFLRLMSQRHDLKRIRVLSINVAPEFQQWGLGLVLLRSLMPKAMEIGVQEAEFSWVSESNDLARMGLEKGGARRYKTYRIYERRPKAMDRC